MHFFLLHGLSIYTYISFFPLLISQVTQGREVASPAGAHTWPLYMDLSKLAPRKSSSGDILCGMYIYLVLSIPNLSGNRHGKKQQEETSRPSGDYPGRNRAKRRRACGGCVEDVTTRRRQRARPPHIRMEANTRPVGDAPMAAAARRSRGRAHGKGMLAEQRIHPGRPAAADTRRSPHNWP